MKKNNVIQVKSFDFARSIVDLYKELVYKKKEYVLSKQLLRSGTSIGANVEEAIGAQSKKDFYAKITIAYKEARESRYWIKLLIYSEYLNKNTGEIYLQKIEEILRIIGSIQISTKKSL